MKLKNALLCLFVLLSFWQCNSPQKEILQATTPVLGVTSQKAMVVSAREEASKIGSEIMQQGGNAFDAMVATEMALAVCYPNAGNLGGGGFMVYRTHKGEIGALDYREKAPLRAFKDMYLDQNNKYLQHKSKTGGLAVGVPGTIAGIFKAHQKFGSLPMQSILRPVILLAKNGFKITEKQAKQFNDHRAVFKQVNQENSIFTKKFKVGDVFKNEALANTLQQISDNGRKAFYQGDIAKTLVAFLQKNKSIISLKDLENYQAIWREPIVFNYKDLRIISMSPPSSGGICMAQILKTTANYPIAVYGHNTTKTIQVLVEAQRRAYADRSHYLGDPDFINIPVDSLLSDAYLKNRMDSFSFDGATPSHQIKHGNIQAPESKETTHYSIVDSYGNAIAVTTTLNASFGSKLYSKKLGFFLNNEMDDFSAKPGTPNLFGLIGADANAIAPQKRMLSSMTPTLVEKDNKLWMSLGTPGGSTIITSVLQTILNVYEFNMSMQQAVDAPRFHHQWLPDVVKVEATSFDAKTIKNLENKGYVIDYKNPSSIGTVDAILVLPDGSFEAGADKRGDDTAVGF
ncbi:MAG TPA: gamma-glutamyltransferase [Flavobacteriaceae bacterium]|nr:gamma-glutamyltransferase [Ulvibacter sp.]HAH33366.1 gamma-glutamyltransferase [Flavobacteriaceae bacterium]